MEKIINKKENIINILVIGIMVFFMGRLFYGSFLYGFILIPIGVVLYEQRKKQIYLKRQKRLEQQFKDMLICLSDSIKTGYSMQNALREAYKDMIGMYGKDSEISRELREVISKLKLNMNVESTISEMAKNINIYNAILFANTFSVVKRTGGSIPDIIKSVTDEIVLKENVNREIEAAIAEKRMEQKIMSIIPMLLIIYVSFASPGFLDVMYTSVAGKLIMTVCIVLYFFAYLWGEKIVSEEET